MASSKALRNIFGSIYRPVHQDDNIFEKGENHEPLQPRSPYARRLLIASHIILFGFYVLGLLVASRRQPSTEKCNSKLSTYCTNFYWTHRRSTNRSYSTCSPSSNLPRAAPSQRRNHPRKPIPWATESRNRRRMATNRSRNPWHTAFWIWSQTAKQNRYLEQTPAPNTGGIRGWISGDAGSVPLAALFKFVEEGNLQGVLH
jgi:hypothetical protein